LNLSALALPPENIAMAGADGEKAMKALKMEPILETTMDYRAAIERVAGIAAKAASGCDDDDAFVSEGYAALKREGLFKAHVPAELGGGGLSHAEMCALIRRLAASCGSTALAFSMHTHIVSVAAWRWRHEKAPTEGLLKRVMNEDLVLVSSGGSDWLKSAGRAERVDGGFKITARKIFASGSPMGDLLVTSAVYDDPEQGPTVLHFAASLKAPGVKFHDNWRVMGMRGTGSQDVELDGVFVPDAAISGRRPQGKWHPLFHTISMIAFPIIYAAYLGVAEGARVRALEIARKKPDDGNIAYLVGEMENAFTSAVLAHDHIVALAANEKPGAETTSKAMIGRTLVGQHAIRTVELALEVAGGGAFYRSVGLERAFRDVQAARFHPLQEKPQLRYTGRVALGLDIDG
jgi:alkylation response protein AidB-like acyl-CoA dehydrogenase